MPELCQMMPTSDIGKLGLSNLYWNILVVCSPPSPAHTLILICPEYGGGGGGDPHFIK